MTPYPLRAPENGSQFTSTTHSHPYTYLGRASHVGHKILITGGTRGIGRCIAVAYARAGAASIAVADIVQDFDKLAHDMIQAAQESGHNPPQIILHKLDVTNEDSVRDCMRLIREEFGNRLDVLVNNAGFMTPALNITETDTTTWWRTMEVNLKGPYLMSKYFVPLLLAASGGPQSIVNINSVAAHNLRPMASAYGTSKFAVLKLTEFLLVEVADKGLVSYSVHPGAVLTALAERGMPADTLAGLTDSPELAASTVVWLSSEKREWLSGRYLSATWDMEELVSRMEEIVGDDKLKVRLVA